MLNKVILTRFYFGVYLSIKHILLAALTLFLFSSCLTSSSSGKNAPFVYLTNNAKFILLPPDGIEKSLDMAQYISASYGNQSLYMNAWVKADETGMEISLMNEIGASLGEILYRDKLVNMSSRVLPSSVSGEYIIADFQLCFYSPSLLRASLENCGLSLVTSGNSRKILSGNDIIIEIEKNSNSVILKNNLRGYSYTLEGDFR
jgi:hypothetical protein